MTVPGLLAEGARVGAEIRRHGLRTSNGAA
jgi:hypothetical protein